MGKVFDVFSIKRCAECILERLANGKPLLVGLVFGLEYDLFIVGRVLRPVGELFQAMTHARRLRREQPVKVVILAEKCFEYIHWFSGTTSTGAPGCRVF